MKFHSGQIFRTFGISRSVGLLDASGWLLARSPRDDDLRSWEKICSGSFVQYPWWLNSKSHKSREIRSLRTWSLKLRGQNSSTKSPVLVTFWSIYRTKYPFWESQKGVLTGRKLRSFSCLQNHTFFRSARQLTFATYKRYKMLQSSVNISQKTLWTQNLWILMIIGSKRKSCGVPFLEKLTTPKAADFDYFWVKMAQFVFP